MTTIPPVERVPITQLTVDGENPNRMTDKQLTALNESIERYGFIIPIITNKDLLVADGEQRLTVAKQRGMTEVPVIRLDVTDVDRRLLRQVLNKLKGEHQPELDAWEYQRILDAGHDQSLRDLILLSEQELQRTLQLIRDPKEETYDAPAIDSIQTDIRRGDLYQLGTHRLLCGDATSKDDLSSLMKEDIADLVLTDPPYNLGMKYSYVGDSKGKYNYEGFSLRWFNLIWQYCNGAMIVTCGKQNLPLWLNHTQPRDIGIWFSKNKMSGGRISHLSLWEPILFYGEIERASRPTDIFDYNVKQQDDVGDHPCPKILPFIKDIVEHYSSYKEIVVDIFGGAGSTLIACEQTDRRCRMMEIDPRYCHVIIQRWEAYTGEHAELLSKNEQL